MIAYNKDSKYNKAYFESSDFRYAAFKSSALIARYMEKINEKHAVFGSPSLKD